MGTWGSDGPGSAGELLDSMGSGVPSSEGSVERREGKERGAHGVLRVPALPSLSGPFGFCSWLQLHPRLQWPWKELLAEILGVASGTGPCAIANCNVSPFHVQETGFSWESAWIMLIRPGVALLFCVVLEIPGSPDPGFGSGVLVGLEPLDTTVLPGGEIWKGNYFSFQAGMQLEARLGRQCRFITKSCLTVGMTGQGL